MKKTLILIFMCLSLITFSQKKDSTYTLLDFYKNNWGGKNPNTGKYFEMHDLDSFSKANKAFKWDEKSLNGLSPEEVKQIFGEPQQISSWNNRIKQTFIDYFYYGNEVHNPKWIRGFNQIQIQFDAATNKVIMFDRTHRMGEW